MTGWEKSLDESIMLARWDGSLSTLWPRNLLGLPRAVLRNWLSQPTHSCIQDWLVAKEAWPREFFIQLSGWPMIPLSQQHAAPIVLCRNKGGGWLINFLVQQHCGQVSKSVSHATSCWGPYLVGLPLHWQCAGQGKLLATNVVRWGSLPCALFWRAVHPNITHKPILTCIPLELRLYV